MKRFLLVLPIVVVVCSVTSTALAILPGSENEIKAGYRKNVAWPWPDNCPDRAHVRAPFNIMIQNGWRRQNLLGEHHFSPDTGKLTRAGELKVHWVMTQAPAQHRQLFVERSLDQQITSKRIELAQQYATRVGVDGVAPSVQDTHLIAEGRPASTVDFINVAFQDSMPTPALPTTSLGGNGGSGGQQ